jgi:hypothetical protein
MVHERGLGLREFADLDWMRNLACRYLARKPLGDFAFVGVSERFEESMAVFSRVLGFRRVLSSPRLNTNPQRGEACYALSADERSFILERNQADLLWYEQACCRLDAERALRADQVA